MKNRIFSLQIITLCAILAILFLGGCTTLDTNEDSGPTALAVEQPYYPAEFKEILIPGGLELDREKTMFITTDSFKGGYLQFSGRLEVNSLTDFFINSMPKNGWKCNGTVKYKNVLLAFSKPGKTCMITIGETKLSMNTEVAIYIAENIGGAASFPSPVSLSEENIIR